MKTRPTILAAVLAVTILGASTSFAQYPDQVLKRFDHPNGPSTFAYVPVEKADGYQEGQTVGIARESRAVAPADTFIDQEEVVVDVPVRRGRGEVIYVPERH